MSRVNVPGVLLFVGTAASTAGVQLDVPEMSLAGAVLVVAMLCWLGGRGERWALFMLLGALFVVGGEVLLEISGPRMMAGAWCVAAGGYWLGMFVREVWTEGARR